MALDRWIGGQDLESSSEVEVASGSRGGFGSKVAVDNYSGKGGIDVGNYIFPFVLCHLFIRIENGGLETRCRCFCVIIRSLAELG